MMEVGSYKFHRRALAALNQLAGDEQAQVLEALAALVDTPAARWPVAQAKRLPGDQSLYLVPVNDSLRAIVRAADGQEPEVMDVVRHETLESFTQAAGNNGN
jgi:hypothetical protein